YYLSTVTVHDTSAFSANRVQWWNDLDEQDGDPTTTGTYLAEPGFVVKTPENAYSLVDSTSDTNSPCNTCNFKVSFGQPGWCGWYCATYERIWMSDTFYFDAQQSGDSPGAITVSSIPNQVVTEGHQLSYQASASDTDNDPLTFSLGSAP